MYDSPDITPNYTRDYRNDSWQQPIWLAFLASVGIHAILGINLPNMSLFSQQVKQPPTVGLVELTPEQISRLPQPKTEPDVSFSNIQPPPGISEIPGQQESFPRLPSSTRTTPSVSNLPTTSVGRSSSSYEIPDRPPTRPTVRLPRRESFPSSVSRLPRNQTPIDDFSNSIPRGSTPISPPPPLQTYRRPLPNLNRPSLPPLPSLPEENQGPTEAEIRRSLNLTDEVFESGLFARNPGSEPGNSNSTSTEFKGSLLDGLRRPQERYQDKIATGPSNSSPATETPATARTETPATPAQQDPTKINRLPESPLARQIRERKAQQRLGNQRQQPEPVAVVTPETRQPETSVEPEETSVEAETNVEPRENQSATPQAKVEVQQPTPAVEEPREFKGSLLEGLERAREQRRQMALTPEATTTPKPEPVETPTPIVAATPKVEPSPVRETAPEVEPSPVPETALQVEPSPVPETAPKVEPSPVAETPREEFKGSLLESLQGDRQPKPEVVATPPQENSTPPNQEVAAATTQEPINIEVPAAEFEEAPATAPTTQGQGEFKGSLLAKLEQYRRQQEQMDAAGEGVFSSKEKLGVNGGVAYMEWAIALGLEERNLMTPSNISDVYPDAACSQNLTGKALVGVLVNADGEIVEGPKLLLGSGSDILDEAALSAVSDRSFETSDKSKAYQYAFSFNNSGCVGQGS
ncbi:MAG: energy transducer TonB [Cyanobacteriota bacterium]|nr:energy transducer TonB [Cyanobacteriota bacterium]